MSRARCEPLRRRAWTLFVITMSAFVPVEATVVHAREGWTNLVSSSTRVVAASGGCAATLRPRACCERHPRASGCGPPRSGASTRTMVRDDLFLEPGSRRSSASAPPVLRGYLACTSDARSQALLHRAANQTARRRAEAAASRLPVLAIVYFGTHHERLGSLRAYELYFERVVYMSPSEAIGTALLSTAASRPIVRAASYHCLQPNKVSARRSQRMRRALICC